MADMEKVIKTIQNRINEARNKQLKVATIFVSTLSDILVLLKEQEAEKKCCKDCEYYGNCHSH